jgi:hypothetical protein
MAHDVNAYKLDSRSKEEFIKDMERGLKNEVEVIKTFRQILKATTLANAEVTYTGSDEEGKIKFDGDSIANVDLFPDYLLKYKSRSHRLRFKFIEVKVCNPHSKMAYFKKNQLEQFRDMGSVLILFVMGIDTPDPKFILVTPEQIMNMGFAPESVYGKDTYKIHVKHFDWESFEVFDRDYNLLDKQFIKGR